MVKRRKTRRKKAKDKLSPRKKEEKKLLKLDPETKHGIVAVGLFTFAILTILSFWDMAGIFGEKFYKYADFLLGEGIFLIPLVSLVAGLIILKYIHRKVYFSVFVGALIFILGFLSLVHILFPVSQAGGYLGYLISWPFLYLLGKWASFIIFVALVLVSILMAFNIPLKRSKKEKKQTAIEDLLDGKSGFAENGEEEREGMQSIGSVLKKILPRPKFNLKTLDKKGKKDKEETDLAEGLTPIPYQASVSDYKFPPIELLEKDKGSPSGGDIRISAAVIQKTLENFGIDVEMGEINVGPTVTQYTLKPAGGIKLSKITTLHRDISLALAAHPIRIEAPIPGRSLVGIEIPNKAASVVRLRNLLEGIDLRKDPAMLNLIIGRDVAGNALWSDLTKMPHLLVAGATGSGKSICVNSIIITLLYQKTPEELKFILIDPKRVELPLYNDIPHLLTPVIVDMNKAVNSLKWAVSEMERRYQVLSEAKVRDIASYNLATSKDEDLKPLPSIVIVIDELADIMGAFGKEVEGPIIRLAQMSRAVGIHLIVSTQRPSVEVITGLIKANITSRIAFQVGSQVDSRTILDMAGAEKLLGNGDMLFLSGETAHPKRVQGVFISAKEVKSIVKAIKNGKEAEYKEEVTSPVQEKTTVFNGSGAPTDDSLYEEAKDLIIQANKASASYLQRRLQIGYARAARLLDILEEEGIIGPADGAKPRKILISKEETPEFDKEDLDEMENEE